MRSIKHFRNAKYKYYDARQKNEMRKIKNNLIYKFHYQKKKRRKISRFSIECDTNEVGKVFDVIRDRQSTY